MIKEIEAKSILSTNRYPSKWFGVKYLMNIYRGCEHRCIYCDSRSECYGIENFDDVLIKMNAVDLLKKELLKKRKKATIGTGAMSDPYTFVERKYELTRNALKVISEYGFPLHISTKSNLVLRDVDILQEISKTYAYVFFTITTCDDKLAEKIEPLAPLPTERFKAMGILSMLGINVGINLMPVLPFLEDNFENINQIVKKASEYGVKNINPFFGVTLRGRQREYFYNELDIKFPGMKEKYIHKYDNNYKCLVQKYNYISERFYEECNKNNISTKMPTYENYINSLNLPLFNND